MTEKEIKKLMREERYENALAVVSFVGIIVFVVFIIALVILRVWVFFTYADVPLEDCPMWVFWFMEGGE